MTERTVGAGAVREQAFKNRAWPQLKSNPTSVASLPSGSQFHAQPASLMVSDDISELLQQGEKFKHVKTEENHGKKTHFQVLLNYAIKNINKSHLCK